MMRDLKILEEWLVKQREAARLAQHRTLISAVTSEELTRAQNCAYVIENITQTIEGIRLLDKDPGEFVKRHLA